MKAVIVAFVFLCATVKSEICRYEFIVPEEKCKPLGESVTNEDEPQSIMHSSSGNVNALGVKLDGIAESFGHELTKLEFDSRNTKEVTSALQTKLDGAKNSIAKLEGFMDEIKSWKETLGKDGLATSKLDNLQSKLMDLTSKIQTQATSQTSIFSSIQRQLAETATSIGKHDRDIESLKAVAQKVEEALEMMKSLKAMDIGEIGKRLQHMEEKVAQNSEPGDVIDQLKYALNLLQNQLLASDQQYRSLITTLSGTVTTLRSDMETLKRETAFRK